MIGDLMLSFTGIAALGVVVWQWTDFAKEVSNRQWSAALTQALAWIVGIGALFLVGATQWAHSVSFGNGLTLAGLSGWDKILAGIVGSSAGSTGWDIVRGIDSTIPTRALSLVPPPPVPPTGHAVTMEVDGREIARATVPDAPTGVAAPAKATRSRRPGR